MSGLAPPQYPGRIVSAVLIWFVVVCMLGIPVAPQEMRPARSSDSGLSFFGGSFAARLASSDSLRREISAPAAVLFVFFSSDSSSLYARGEPRASGLANSELGSSLTRPADMDALLGSTSLVPESPAWEPMLPNTVLSRITVFPDWRRRSSQQSPALVRFRTASPTHDYLANSPALVAW